MLQLLGKNVAIDPILYEAMSPTGLLHIPDTAIPRANQGIVKYIGPEVKEIKIGDYVLFSGYSGTTVRLEGEGLVIIMHEDFINCVLENPGTLILGLYFRTKDGEYITATYEDAIPLLSRALQDYAVVKTHKPAREEYDAK